MQGVSGSIPLSSTNIFLCDKKDAGFNMSPSSRGLGHCPFTAVTRVRIPLETPNYSNSYLLLKWRILAPSATIVFILLYKTITATLEKVTIHTPMDPTRMKQVPQLYNHICIWGLMEWRRFQLATGSLFKPVYCACQKIKEKWNMQVQNCFSNFSAWYLFPWQNKNRAKCESRYWHSSMNTLTFRLQQTLFM